MNTYICTTYNSSFHPVSGERHTFTRLDMSHDELKAMMFLLIVPEKELTVAQADCKKRLLSALESVYVGEPGSASTKGDSWWNSFQIQ